MCIHSFVDDGFRGGAGAGEGQGNGFYGPPEIGGEGPAAGQAMLLQ